MSARRFIRRDPAIDKANSLACEAVEGWSNDRLFAPGAVADLKKSYGNADALKVNDSRFLPTYHFAEPCKPGGVVVEIG